MNTPSTSADRWASSSDGWRMPLPEERDALRSARGCVIGALLGLLAWALAIGLALLWFR